MITPIRSGRRLAVVGALAISAALGLAACTPSAPDDPQETRTLTIAIAGQPPSFDPAAADNGESAYIWSGIFDTLLGVDPDGAVIPNAAQAWEYSEDGKTLTLTLHDNLTFSDGSPVTAEDVASTIDRSRTTPGVRATDLAAVESVDAADDHTVVLHLNEADPGLLTALAQGAGIIGQASTLDDESIALNPVGSGPYVLDESATTAGATYVLNRREDYWNFEAYPFAKVTVRVIADPQAQFNALQAGEIDLLAVGPDKVDAVKSAGFDTKEIAATAWGGLAFLDRAGTIVPALGDKRVRAAIEMAFDRDLYIEQLLLGGGQATDQILNPALAGYDPDLDDYWKYDIEEAKKLLAEAGYPHGFDVVMPSSYFSTTFEPAVTQSLADIGVRVTWEPVPPQELVTSLSSGRYGLAWWFEGLNDPALMTQSSFAVDGFLNPFGYTTPELTGLFEELAGTTDPDEQASIYEEISRYGVENALVAPLFYVGSTWAAKPGYQFLPNGNIPITLRNFGAE